MFDDLKPPYDPEKEVKDLRKDLEHARKLLKESRDELVRQRGHIGILKNDFAEAQGDAKRFAEHIRDCHKALEEYRRKHQQADFDDVDFNFDEDIEIDITNLEEVDN